MASFVASCGQATATHTRHHGSVLATVERRALVWLAGRMPPWVTSDGLTFLGAAGMAGVGGALAAASASRGWLAFVPVFLAINWFGDSLDGRWRGCAMRSARGTATTWITWSIW